MPYFLLFDFLEVSSLLPSELLALALNYQSAVLENLSNHRALQK